MNISKYLSIFYHLYHLYIRYTRHDDRCNACFKIGLYRILDPNNPKIKNYMQYEDTLFKKTGENSMKKRLTKLGMPKHWIEF